jgi:hypothetical protein
MVLSRLDGIGRALNKNTRRKFGGSLDPFSLSGQQTLGSDPRFVESRAGLYP